MVKKYFTEDTYLKFDEGLNDFVQAPLLFPPQEMLGETVESQQTVYGASHGDIPNVPGERFVRVETCDLCNQEYKLVDLVEFRGKYYCKVNMHNRAIHDIIMEENAGKFRGVPETVLGSTDVIIDQSIK